MALQAFMDESLDKDGTFVIGGHIAHAEAWAAFSEEWEQMLPLGTLADDGTYHFKMAEMAAIPERMDRVPGFYRIIEKHALHSLSCRINERELHRAMDRINVPNQRIDWSGWRNPYIAGYRVLMDTFHLTRDGIQKNAPTLPADAKIDFYFDERGEKGEIRKAWSRYLDSRDPKARALYGNEPRFENDRTFLPLQAADLWAWWVRKWCAEGQESLARGLLTLDFGRWKAKSPVARTHMQIDEEKWVGVLADTVAPLVGRLVPIFDRKTGKVVRLGAR